MAETTTIRVIPRSADEVWAALADFGGIVRWAPNVDHSCLTSTHTAGVGTVRRVQTGRTTLLERVVQWEPGRLLAYVIEGLPPVVRSVQTTWHLDDGHPDDAGDTTRVSVTTRIDAGPRPPQQLIARVMTRPLSSASRQMLQGLDEYLQATTAQEATLPGSTP